MVDSSAWIEYLRATGSHADRHLTLALSRRDRLWTPAVVYQEVLQGARSPSHFMQLQSMMDASAPWTPDDERETARKAALLYSRCRWQGVTIRSANDCLIAVSAIEAGQPLLHADHDFERMAAIESRLRLV